MKEIDQLYDTVALITKRLKQAEETRDACQRENTRLVMRNRAIEMVLVAKGIKVEITEI